MQLSNIIERLAKVPRVQRLVIYGGFYVIICVAYWGLIYNTASSNLASAKKQSTELNSQRVAVEQRVQYREKFNEELDALTNDLKQALKELPNDREIPGLLKGITALGRKVGVEMRKFQPLPEVKQEYVAEVPVELELEGSFHEVAMFFDRLSKMNRIVYVQNIEISNPVERGGKVYLTVAGESVTFRFLTEAELGAQKKQEGKKGKRRRKRSKGGG